MQIANKFYDLFPGQHTRRGLYGDALLSTAELVSAYCSGEMIGAITTDGDLPWYAKRAAQYDEAACIDLLGGEKVAIYEESELGEPNRYGADIAPVDHHYQWLDYLFEDPEKAMKGRQLTGDCTSWMVRLMLQLLRLERMKAGHQEIYKERLATAGYYANRGHNGQGSNPMRQCTYAAQIGYVFEIVYGSYDLRNYDSYYRLGMNWGRSGVPSSITEVTAQHKPGKPKLIRSLAGYLDAAGKKYPIGLGSSLGAASVGDPISAVSGSWNHAMGDSGFDNSDWARDTFRLGSGDFLIFKDQSWGNWNRVSNLPDRWKPWPEGQFVMRAKSIERYITGGECICYVPDESDGVPAIGDHPFLL